MNEKNLFEAGSKINKVLSMHQTELNSIISNQMKAKIRLEDVISDSETILNVLNTKTLDDFVELKRYGPEQLKTLTVLDFEEIASNAEEIPTSIVTIEDFFTTEELEDNQKYFKELRKHFKDIHTLDKWDYAVAGIAGTIAALLDYFLVTKMSLSNSSVHPGKLKSGVDNLWDTLLPPDVVKKLEKNNKVSFDVSTNTSRISQEVLGLNPNYHRFQSLGHDPLIGFIFGIKDMMQGELTAIDGNGRWTTQRVSNFSEKEFTEAIITQFRHLLSDVSASSPGDKKLSIPAPLTPLLQMVTLGSVSYKNKHYTIADLSKRMYSDGYNFNHFIGMSVPVVIIHIIIGLYTTLRSLFSEDYVKSRQKKDLILFTANSILCAENIGKFVITKNPFAINYVSWIETAKYSTRVMKDVMVDNRLEEIAYVQKMIEKELAETYAKVEETWVKYNSEEPILYI